MTGMSMPQQTWYGAATGFLGMWMAMIVPMMLPSLIPMLSRYRRSVQGADGIHLHELTALAGMGYFVIWAIVGAVVYAAGIGLMTIEMRWGTVERWLPVATGVALLAAGGVQITSWKARQLSICREGSACDSASVPTARGAWGHGLTLGVRCSLCCGGLMLALLAIGMMDLFAMVAVTLAISAERLTPVPLRVARAVGVAILAVGVVTIVRV
jgi:predicted metal-binding membrane protein